MIDRDTIQRVMNATDIVDVVKEFVTLHKAGVNMKGLCPFHDEKTPSFVVSPAKQLCKCFSCGKGGNAVHFLMEHEQFTYPEAIRWLGKKYGIEIKEKELTNEERAAQSERESMFILNEWACKYFQDTLHNTPDGTAIGMSYFRSRSFRDDIIRKFQLGYSPERGGGVAAAAIAQGYKEEYLLKTGLAFKTEQGRLVDRYHGRVIFPVHTVSGKVVAFGGRILGDKNKNVGKYVNSPESEIYSKSHELYGLYQAKHAIVKQGCCFLVEGYTDVISMHQSGIENVVASSGTSLTEGQIRLLHRFTNNITMLYDGDSAGIKASLRGIDMLLAEGLNIRVLLLPDGEDPDSFARTRSAEDFVNYIDEHQVDIIKFKTNLLLEDAGDDPIKRANLVTDIVRSISVIPEGIVRQMYAHECAIMMSVPEAVILDEITKMRRERRRAAQQPDARNEEGVPAAESAVKPELIIAKKPDNYEERLMTELIIRNGGKYLYFEDGTRLTVVQMVAEDLLADGLEITTPIYRTVFEDALAASQQGTDGDETQAFDARQLFLQHTDIEISRLATEILQDKYQLSKSQREMLHTESKYLEDLVFRIIHDFKLARVTAELKALRASLTAPEIKTNIQAQLEILRKIKDLSEVERRLSQVLGDRVVAR